MIATRFAYANEADSQFSSNVPPRRVRPSVRLKESDTYQGVVSDPISLHKYLYADANPITGIDPTGHNTLTDILSSVAIQSVLVGITIPVISGITSYKTGGGFWNGVWRGTPAGAAVFFIALRDGGPLKKQFADDMASILLSTVCGVTADSFIMYAKDMNNFNFTAKLADDLFWKNFTTFAEGKAFKNWLGDPVGAAGAAALTKVVVGSPGLLVSAGSNFQLMFQGKETHWDDTLHSAINLSVDAAIAFYKVSMNEGVPEIANLPEPIQTIFKTALWAGVSDLLQKLKQ